MTEEEYIGAIDANFPYDDEGKWKALIAEGANISDNAAYMALHEIICGAPPGISLSALEEMLEYWSEEYDHPTKPIVLKIARARLKGITAPENEVLSYMDVIAQYPGLHNALGVVAGSPDDWTEAVERKYNQIRIKWGKC